MSGTAFTPWGKQPLDVSSRGGDALTAAPAADSHISAGAAFCSASRAEGAEPGPVPELSEPALMVLQLIAAHHFCGLGRAVELAAFAYADEIGLPALLDARRDIAAEPPFERSGQNRFSQTCESEPGRQEAPLGLLPMPHAPP